MRKEKVKFRSGKHELIGVLHIPEKTPAPAVILLHGLTNNKDDCPLFKEMIDGLKNDFIVFRFDQFGSGESPGQLKDKMLSILAQNCSDAVDFLVKDKRVLKIGVFGVSIGASVLTIIGDHPKIGCGVMISPQSKLVRDWERDFAQPGDYVKYAGAQTGKIKGEGVLSRAFFNELYELDKKIPNVLKKMKNIMICHGADDDIVPPLCATEVFNAVNNPKELHIIWGAGHNCKKAKEEVVEKSIKWFENFLG